MQALQALNKYAKTVYAIRGVRLTRPGPLALETA